MKERHRKLYDENRIKIYNCSIFDEFLLGKKDKIDEHCFVVGMEILDNMPHDRLYIDKDTAGTSEFEYQLQSIIELSQDAEGNEILKEILEPVGSDPLIIEFLQLLKSMPAPDHVTLNNKLQFGGFIKRIKDVFDDYRWRSEIESNIFAPTATLNLFKQVNRMFPNHQMILADFDCFLTSLNKKTLKGINAPLITNKLQSPTDWDKYETYMIPRGAADICFPSDFHFLQHAYREITKQPVTIYKNKEFIDIFALESWATTQNNYNPMREEYFNTSFLVTEYGKGKKLNMRKSPKFVPERKGKK